MNPSTSGPSSADSSIVDVAIVGGGLCGLTLAANIVKHNQAADSSTTAKSIVVLEAHAQHLGGRLRNAPETEERKYQALDMGGTWVWTESGQVAVKQLLSSLGLIPYPQPDDPSSGTFRVPGGAFEMIRRLEARIVGSTVEGKQQIRRGWAVQSVTRDEVTGLVTLVNERKEVLQARSVVFTVPPKLLESTVTFKPELSVQRVRTMQNSPTWMAGVTKVSLIFHEKRFWPLQSRLSNTGLPFSVNPIHKAHAFQCYDAGDGATFGAITFFTLAPPELTDEELARRCAQQVSGHWRDAGQATALVKKVLQYDSFQVQRWPDEKYISDDANPSTIHPHPRGKQGLGGSEWQGQLLFAGSECSQKGGSGLMNGAVLAANDMLEKLYQPQTTTAS